MTAIKMTTIMMATAVAVAVAVGVAVMVGGSGSGPCRSKKLGERGEDMAKRRA